MSRAPTPAPKPPLWKQIDDKAERYGAAVLVTSDPDKDHTGTPAFFYRRRVNREGRWKLLADWCGVTSRMSLDPQPTHWRPDPARARLDPEGSIEEKTAA
jgi:hypothetical protein